MATPQHTDDLDPINEAFLEDFQAAGAPPQAVQRLNSKLMGYKMRFNRFDEDGSGDLSFEELRQMMTELNKQKTEKELEEIISRVDDDNSGTIRYSEFVNLMLLEDKIITEPMKECVAKVEVSHAKDARKRRRGAQRKEKRGHLHLQYKLERRDDAMFRLSVDIYEARHLQSHDWNGKSDPYVKIYIVPMGPKDKKQSYKKKTKTVKKSLNPVYGEKFYFDLTEEEIMAKSLQVAVWDWDRIGANDFMGMMTWSLEKIREEAVPVKAWFILLDEEVGSSRAFRSREEDVKFISSGDGGDDAGGGGSSDDQPPNLLQDASYLEVASTASAGAKRKDLSDFNLISLMGEGTYGKIFLAQDKHNKKDGFLAIKCLNKERIADSKNFQSFRTERQLLAMPPTPFLLHMHHAFQTSTHLYFVMEAALGGDLMFYVLKMGSLPENHVRFYAAECAVGLSYLHKNNILYRDLKLDNVLLNRKGHVVLCDFGLCKIGVPPNGTTVTFCGTPDYMAPEILMYEPYGRAVDWWSLGIMMYEMLTGEAPFDGETEQDLYANITDETVRIRFPRWCKADTTEVLRGLLTREQDRRLGSAKGLEEIKVMKFFQQYGDWSDLVQQKVKPPIIPMIKNPLDNFDEEFTARRAIQFSPVDEGKLDQHKFADFEYSREN